MVQGSTRQVIANEIVRLHSEYYGRGPTRAKVYADGDMIAVVLEETFTPAEKTLILGEPRTDMSGFAKSSQDE